MRTEEYRPTPERIVEGRRFRQLITEAALSQYAGELIATLAVAQ